MRNAGALSAAIGMMAARGMLDGEDICRRVVVAESPDWRDYDASPRVQELRAQRAAEYEAIKAQRRERERAQQATAQIKIEAAAERRARRNAKRAKLTTV